MDVKKLAIRTALALVLLLALGVVVDSAIAARAEHRISDNLYANSNLATPPKVQLAGFPYVSAAFTHELQAITVNAADVDVPGFGLMGVYTSAQYVTVSREDVLQGKIDNAPARKVFTKLQLDGVLLGNRMNIHELLIQNKDDISPRGGWETEATFEGTPDGFTQPVKVEVKLRILRGAVEITPLDIIEAPVDHSVKADRVKGDDLPENIAAEIRSAFTLHIPGSQLPLRDNPVRVYVAGGSMFVETEQYYTRVSLSDLVPRSRPLSEEEQPGL